MIKKLISLALVALMALSVAGCSSDEQPDNGGRSRGGSQNEISKPVEPMDYNYLTGLPFTDGQDEYARPIAVMINNAKIALPQYGLNDADIIYEAVTEGGITRLMALYSDINKIGRVGPVRSARTQFVELMLPLNAIYVHIGSSITANTMLNTYSYQDVDGIYLGSIAFEYDSALAEIKPSEHCWFTNKDLINAGIRKTGINTKNNFYPAFEFVYHEDEPRIISDKVANTVSYAYSSYADVAFTYNEETGRYYKYAFGAPHMDAGYNTQVGFDNVFVLLADVGIEVENGVLPDFDYLQGEGYYFNGGRYEKVMWKKGQPEYPLVIYSKDGEVLQVNTGKSYVGFLGTDMKDTLAISEAVQAPVDVDRVQ